MKDKIILSLFLLTGAVPVYTFLGWIYVFDKYPDFSQVEKQRKFNQDIFLGIHATDSFFMKLAVILLGLGSIAFFIVRLVKIQNKIGKSSQIVNIALTGIIAIFTLLSIWTIL